MFYWIKKWECHFSNRSEAARTTMFWFKIHSKWPPFWLWYLEMNFPERKLLEFGSNLNEMFFPRAPVNNIAALLYPIASHCTGDKRLSESIRGSPANWRIVYPLMLIILNRNTMYMQHIPTCPIMMIFTDDIEKAYDCGQPHSQTIASCLYHLP